MPYAIILSGVASICNLLEQRISGGDCSKGELTVSAIIIVASCVGKYLDAKHKGE